MIRYIGTKIIHAEPHDRLDGDGKVTPGYTVQYEDGYVSWSPKDTFEAAYQRATGMTFGMALEAMKKGLRVTRGGWASAHVVSLGENSTFRCEDVSMVWPGWFPTNLDMLADDWITV